MLEAQTHKPKYKYIPQEFHNSIPKVMEEFKGILYRGEDINSYTPELRDFLSSLPVEHQKRMIEQIVAQRLEVYKVQQTFREFISQIPLDHKINMLDEVADGDYDALVRYYVWLCFFSSEARPSDEAQVADEEDTQEYKKPYRLIDSLALINTSGITTMEAFGIFKDYLIRNNLTQVFDLVVRSGGDFDGLTKYYWDKMMAEEHSLTLSES